MKYIRTKDAIFKVTSKAGHIYCAENQNNEFVLVNGRVVEKEADTIEELCDEIVYVNDNKHKNYPCYAVSPEDDVKYHDAIYAAIWTDKGLVYVAKMNEKGVLELL